MKFIQILIFILLTSNGFVFSQELEGYILSDRLGKNPAESGINQIDIELILKDDTLRSVTNVVGYFHFDNIKEKKVRLIGRKRHYFAIDTIIEIGTNIKPDTFYCSFKGRNRKINNCYNKATALNDIQSSQMVILLPGGIISTEIYNKDTIFEKKYNIEYTCLGCIRYDCTQESEYNDVIFKYLDEQYGIKWRSEVRRESIGLSR